MDPLHIVVDQVIKNLHNLKIIIKGVLLKRINSNCFQFSFSIQSDTWACKLLILMSCRGVWKSSLGNWYFSDPLMTYCNDSFAMIGVFWISTKESSCLEGNKEKTLSDIHGVQVFCIQCGVDLLGVHLNGSVHFAQGCKLDQLVGCHLQDLDTISV